MVHTLLHTNTLQQKFMLSFALSLPHTMVEEASRYNFFFVRKSIKWLWRYVYFKLPNVLIFCHTCMCTIPIVAWHVLRSFAVEDYNSATTLLIDLKLEIILYHINTPSPSPLCLLMNLSCIYE